MWHHEDVLEIHPFDAENRGIEQGDLVAIASRAGETTLRAEVTERIQPGVVYTTFHHPVTGANVVTTEFTDWATGCPEYKVTAVEVRLAKRMSEWQEHYLETRRQTTKIEHGTGADEVNSENMVHMANQIAQFFASYPHEEAVAGVADHIQKFWEKRMRQQLQRLHRHRRQRAERTGARSGQAVGLNQLLLFAVLIQPLGPTVRRECE